MRNMSAGAAQKNCVGYITAEENWRKLKKLIAKKKKKEKKAAKAEEKARKKSKK